MRPLVFAVTASCHDPILAESRQGFFFFPLLGRTIDEIGALLYNSGAGWIHAETGRCMSMFGQKTIPDPHQEIVVQYLKDHNPCEPSKPLRIDLRKYLDYAEEHHITDPSTLPDEILDQFMLDHERIAQ